MKRLFSLLCALVLGLVVQGQASISLVLNLGKVDSWTSGAVWLASAGTDNVFSNPFINDGTSLVGTGDTYIAGVMIDSSNNNGGGVVGSIAIPFTVNYGTGIANGNKLAVYYVSATTSDISSFFNLDTGVLKGSYKFGSTGGTALPWATYAGSNTAETAGTALDPAMGWVLPSDSGASGLNLSVFTLNDPTGSIADIPIADGSLNFLNTINVIPEPSVASLIILATCLSSLAVRRRKGEKV